MKKVFFFLFFFAALASAAVGQNESDWFKTRWKAPASGIIKFSAVSNGYTIRYVKINPVTGITTGSMQTINNATVGQVISGLTPGDTYRVDAYGSNFKRVDFSHYNNNINRMDFHTCIPCKTH